MLIMSATSVAIVSPGRVFNRANLGGGGATALDIANVLGRWQRHADWDTIGKLVEMDKLFDSTGEIVDGPALRDEWARWEELNPMRAKRLAQGVNRERSLPVWGDGGDPRYAVPPELELSGSQPFAARSAERRGFCKRKGQAQRWWHRENVPLLPFTSESLATSVGSSVVELNALAVNPLACDVVFDSLARSQSGIVDKDVCDSRRTALQTEDGAFDADALQASLDEARRNVLIGYAIFPGLLNVVFLIVFIQVDGLQLVQDSFDQVMATVQGNMELWQQLRGGPM
jgi:hypothetical protein